MQLDKVTKTRQIEDKRRYDDACGLAHALDLVGERWALLVLRELMFGPRRFSGLRRDLPGISANVLSQRLMELEQRGLVRRTQLAPPASVQVYEATEWGLEAAPVSTELHRSRLDCGTLLELSDFAGCISPRVPGRVVSIQDRLLPR